MTMEDWASRLDIFLEFDEHAASEFEKYSIVQDRLFMSDFDKLLLEMEDKNE